MSAESKNERTLHTGFKTFDELIAGFLPSDLIIVGGRPATGKTTLCLNIAQRFAMCEDKPVAIFSLEMSKEQPVQRLLSSKDAVDLHRLRSGKLRDEDWSRLIRVVDSLHEAPIFIDDTAALSVPEIRERAERLTTDLSCGIGLIEIDYLQLIKRPQNTEGMSEVMEGLKSLAKELAVPVIVASQLRRSVDTREDKRPQIADLSDAHIIEPYADTIMLIHRNEVSKTQDGKTNRGKMEIIVAKYRNGRIGTVELAFEDRDMAIESPILVDGKHYEVPMDKRYSRLSTSMAGLGKLVDLTALT